MRAEEVPFSALLSEVVDNRGKTCPTAETGIPLIATNCVRNELLYPTYEKARFVSQETYDTWFRGHPQPGDIIFVNKATPGRVCLVPDPVDFCIAQDMVAVRANEKKVYPKFLFALLRSPAVQAQIEQMHVGTLIPHFKKGDFDKLMLPIPDRKVQEFIGDTYFTLSAKIELNGRMNETLERLAQGLFKAWFVDAAREGLPRGWREESIYAVASVIYGAPFSSSKFNTGRLGKPLIRIRDLADESPEVFTPEEHPKGYLVKAGDIVVGMDGEFRAHLWGGEEGWLNQRVCVFAPKPSFSAPFVLNSIVSLLAEVEATETATTVIHIGKNDIDRFKIAVPDDRTLAKFNDATVPLYRKIVLNKRESRTLAALRDGLLPKLLSGEVRVAAGARLVEGQA